MKAKKITQIYTRGDFVSTKKVGCSVDATLTSKQRIMPVENNGRICDTRRYFQQKGKMIVINCQIPQLYFIQKNYNVCESSGNEEFICNLQNR